MRGMWWIGALLVAFGCSGSGEQDEPAWKKDPVPCTDDGACAKGFICKDKICQPGERSKTELAAREKAKAAAAKKSEKPKAPKPGEGRLRARICPGFKRTPEAIGTIIAVNQKTKKRHLLHLAMEVAEGGIGSEFTFPSLPLGMYDVTASYGVQIKHQAPETVVLKCHEKAKPCREETIREIEVIPPEKEPPVKLTDAGLPRKKACDWWAE